MNNSTAMTQSIAVPTLLEFLGLVCSRPRVGKDHLTVGMLVKQAPPGRRRRAILKARDFRHARKGVPHLKVSGKGGKTRYLPLHSATNALIHDYLNAAGHGTDDSGALFRPTRNNRTGHLEAAITADGVYKLVSAYSAQLGFEIGAHALRATAATNALDHDADIAKVQEWLTETSPHGHRRNGANLCPACKIAPTRALSAYLSNPGVSSVLALTVSLLSAPWSHIPGADS